MGRLRDLQYISAGHPVHEYIQEGGQIFRKNIFQNWNNTFKIKTKGTFTLLKASEQKNKRIMWYALIIDKVVILFMALMDKNQETSDVDSDPDPYSFGSVDPDPEE